jgi:CubicO group peptidase (beta-lactamase class C family)
MRRWPRAVLTLTLIALVSAAAPAAAQDLKASMDAYVQAHVAVNHFSGAVLVARGGQVIFEKGYGPADAEWNVPNSPQTKFRLGSVTKQFTAAAILLLQEQGKLSVQDPVCRFLAPCPEAWAPITVHHLLTHTSGIPNLTDFPDYRSTMGLPSPAAKTIDRFSGKPLEFVPGSTFKYSNSGYIVLGLIVEKASGMPYAAFLSERILKPLQMNDTGYDDPAVVLSRRASGYALDGERLRNAAFIDMTVPGGAGALYSTVEDLLKWDQALYTDRLLAAASREAMFTPFKQNYAYGWTVTAPSPATFGRRQIAHGGGINGFATYIARFPDDKVTVVVLSNLESGRPAVVARDLAAIVFGEKYETPVVRQAIHVDPKTLERYVGQYELAPAFILTVTREGDRLFTQATGQQKIEVFAETPVKFFLRVVDAQITFVEGADGSVASLVLHQNGRDMPAKKIK